MSRNRPHWKAQDLDITPTFLTERAERSASRGYAKAKWIEFCETMLKHNLSMTLYEAKKSRSKYIKVRNEDKVYKVRFSNHMPIKEREKNGDCDFFVGQTHQGRTTTSDAVEATLSFLIGRPNIQGEPQ